MHAFRTLRHVVAPAAGRLLAVTTTVALSLTIAPAGAWAAPVSVLPDPDVRLVVRTTSRAAAADVVADATRRGATPAGRIGRLRAVALDVPAARAERVRAGLLRRDDVRSVDAAHRRRLSEEPADPRFADQRTYFAAVRATDAWGRPAQGAPNVRIAVIDSGVDVTHPDLVGKIAGRFNAVTGSNDVRDVVGHGTGVASVAAASTNNGAGMAGAGYDSTVLAAKVADRTGRIFTDDLAAGIVWAADSGADVINLSLGGPTSDRLERDAIDYAPGPGCSSSRRRATPATGASSTPPRSPGPLGGRHQCRRQLRAPFSTFGSWVDVAAPGRDILVAVPGGGYRRPTARPSPRRSSRAGRPARGLPSGAHGVRASPRPSPGARTPRSSASRADLVDFAAAARPAPAGFDADRRPRRGRHRVGLALVSVSTSAPASGSPSPTSPDGARAGRRGDRRLRHLRADRSADGDGRRLQRDRPVRRHVGEHDRVRRERDPGAHRPGPRLGRERRHRPRRQPRPRAARCASSSTAATPSPTARRPTRPTSPPRTSRTASTPSPRCCAARTARSATPDRRARRRSASTACTRASRRHVHGPAQPRQGRAQGHHHPALPARPEPGRDPAGPGGLRTARAHPAAGHPPGRRVEGVVGRAGRQGPVRAQRLLPAGDLHAPARRPPRRARVPAGRGRPAQAARPAAPDVGSHRLTRCTTGTSTR